MVDWVGDRLGDRLGDIPVQHVSGHLIARSDTLRLPSLVSDQLQATYK